MNINSALQEFKNLVKEFTNHKDFTSQGNKIFKQKQKWLVDFSKSFNSLGVCLLIIENDDEPTSIYFASQFVKDKLKFEFQQLSNQAIMETHAKLKNIMKMKTNLSKIVINNIALCLVYLYIHCYETVGTVLDFFKNTLPLGENPNIEDAKIFYKYLFRYLDGLPSQIDNRRLVIDEIKRNEVQKALKNQQTLILMEMHQLYLGFNQPNCPRILSSDDLEHMLLAFSEWLRIGSLFQEVIKSLHSHSILNEAVVSMLNPQLSEAASQCLLSLIQTVKTPQQNYELYKWMGNHLMRLANSVQKQIEEQQFDEAQNIVKVLCQYGTRAGKIFVQSFNQSSVQLFTKMIKITEEQNLQVFQQLIDFWESIIFFIMNRKEGSTMSIEAANQMIALTYNNYIKKIMFTPNQIEQLNQLSQTNLSKYHQNVEEVLEKRQKTRYIFESVSKYFGHEPYVEQVYKAISAVEKDGQFYSKVQAYIYSLRDAVKSITRPTPELCNIIMLYQNFTDKPVILMKSYLRLYESLMGMQLKNQEFIIKMIGHITQMMGVQLLNQKAGKVFNECCKKNPDVLVKHIQSVYGLLEKYPKNTLILTGITNILKSYPQLFQTHLPVLLQGPLQILKTSTSSTEKRNTFNRIFTILECIPKGQTQKLTAFILALLEQMMPIVLKILQIPQKTEGDEDKIVERAVRFLKVVMRSIPEQFIVYLQTVYNTVLIAYRKYPICSYVYLYEATFKTYYGFHHAELITFLKMLYTQICEITYKHITDLSKIHELHHLVDDFIGLNKRIITFHTRMFFESGQVQPILQFTIHCLGSGEPNITSTTTQLFEIMFMIYWSPYSREHYKSQDKGQVIELDSKNNSLYAELKTYILPSIPNLLSKMFKFLESGPVQSIRDNVLDCFEAVALAFPQQSQAIWAQPLNQLQEDILTKKQKQRFKQNLLKMGSNNHSQFLKAEEIVGRLLYTISNRYLYRKSRSTDLSNRG